MPRLSFLGFFFILLLGPAVDAAAVDVEFEDHLYNDRFPKKDVNCRLIVSSEDTNTTLHISAHVEALNQIQAFAAQDDEKSTDLKYAFHCEDEVSAFKKVLFFLYKNADPNMRAQRPNLDHFFEPHDLTALILLADSYKIELLGNVIAAFLHKQINQKIDTFEETTVIFDKMTKDQFADFYIKMSSHRKVTGWLEHIRNSVRTYTLYLISKSDARIDCLEVPSDANIYLAICQRRAEIERTHQRALNKQELQRQADLIAEEIFNQHKEYINKYQTKATTPITYLSYRVPQGIARLVQVSLEKQLPTFDVYLDPDIRDWDKESDLCMNESNHCTVGYCLSRKIGWAACLLLYPIQILTCNYLGCCGMNPPFGDPAYTGKYSCFGSTQVGAAVSHCVYDMASCYRRSIVIAPKDEPENFLRSLSPPPPPERHFDIYN